MIARQSYKRTAFDVDPASLLQTLLTTPIAPNPSPHNPAPVRVGTRQINDRDALSPLLRNMLTSSPRSEVASLHASANTVALLQTLLQTPVPSVERYPPVALRGVGELRRVTLRNTRQAESFDTLLVRSQWALTAIAVLALGSWAAFGPVGNWVHARYTARAASEIAQQGASQSVLAARVNATPIVAAEAEAQPSQATATTPPQEIGTPEPDYLGHRSMVVEQRVVALPQQPSHLLIQAIGVDAPVEEVFFIDGDWEVAHYAVGYLHNTALPGEDGNVVLAGHAGFFGGVFANLARLNKGDDIFLDAAGWRYHYRVRGSIVIPPTETDVLRETFTPTLTLITCTNWDTQRIVVTADLVGDKPL